MFGANHTKGGGILTRGKGKRKEKQITFSILVYFL